MAVKQNSSFGHFLIRLLGMTGVLGLVIGGTLWLLVDLALAGLIVLLVGLVLVAAALLVELKVVMDVMASRRGAFGLNVFAQVLLAMLLLVGVNMFSFLHGVRWDWTREAIFTLPADIRQQLSKLQGETDIIVYQRHTAFGQSAEAKPDNYDAAAERKIVEKIQDLAEEFQELGPRFRVLLLDSQEEAFQEKLGKIKDKSPELAAAIEKAPENSIFFYSAGKVQSLAFHDIYQLDREASKNFNGGQGNLVLNYQGPGPIARRIFNIEEKKPRVALGVIHELLSFSGNSAIDFYTMAGAGATLRAHGFDTVDLILKKWFDDRNPEPSVLTFDESRFEALEADRVVLDEDIKVRSEEIGDLTKLTAFFKNSSLPEINKKYGLVVINDRAIVARQDQIAELKKSGRQFRTFPVDQEIREEYLKIKETELAFHQIQVEQERKELDVVVKEQKNLNVENLAEQRRITDVEAKLNRLLADVDLLILPRVTALDYSRVPPDILPNRLHALDEAQVKAVKAFLRKGKPVLFCLGPTNEPMRGFDPSDLKPDAVESMLGEFGFQLPKETILFNVESKSFAERKGGLIIMGTQVEPPPVKFQWPAGAGYPGKALASRTKVLPPHPIRASLMLASNSVAPGPALDLRLRHPRPVYVETGKNKEPYDPTLFMSVPESWNETQPFTTGNRTPKFEPPKVEDPSNGTIREKRRGPFPLAAAIETPPPPGWSTDANDESSGKLRLEVIGHGGVFTGKNLSVIQQKLLLDSCNWLLGREDLLARASEEPWSFPRVQLSTVQVRIWLLVTCVLLPLLFVYLGVTVALVRLMR